MKIRSATLALPSASAVRRLALAGLALSATPLFAATFTSTWTGGSANWSSVANWITPGAPGTFPNNGGSTYDAVLGVNSTVTLDQAIVIQKFTMSTGTLVGNFGLTTNELFAWTGGIISATGGSPGPVNANDGVSFGGSAVKSLAGGRTLNLGGNSTWTAGEIRIGNGGILNNQAGFTFDTNFNGTLQNAIGLTGTFNNAGTFTKSGGTGTTTIGGGGTIVFNNTGTVNIQTGTLALTGTVTQHSGTTLTGGTWNVSGGASINITTGSNITTNQGSVTLDGAGSSFAKFTIALSSNAGSFTLKNDRDLTTAGALANSGNVNVDGAGTTLTIPGANAYSQTAGATLLSNGGQISAPAATLTGGTFTVNGGATGSVLAVTNAGAGLTFGGTGSPTITLDSSNAVPGKILLTNNVTVDNTLTSGTAQILSGGGGANPGVIDLDGGTRTFSVNNGSAAVDLRVSASLQNGALTKTGLGTLALTGANTFTGGTTVSGGVLEAAGSSALGGTSGVIINTGGTLLLSGSGNRVNDAAGITLVGGKFDTGGFSETVGKLTLTGDSVIDMGAGASILHFADSHLETWTGTLRILNWSGNQNIGGGTDQLYFGNGSGIGLEASQLLQVKFYSDAGTTILPYAPGFSAFTGGFGEVVPVPEPSSVATAMGLLGLIGWRERRRRR